jgi:hypothetical protein
MPAEFDACRKSGGKIRTISGPNKSYGLSANQYLHICVGKNGKIVRGEVKNKIDVEKKKS